jgi:hypothetical protein
MNWELSDRRKKADRALERVKRPSETHVKTTKALKIISRRFTSKRRTGE